MYTAAPEVLNRNYDERCDLWSIGVMAYVLLSGRAPFGGCHGETEKAPIIKNILRGNYDIETPKLWDHVSYEAKDFIRKLLVKNCDKRATVFEAQKLPWLQKHSGNSRVLSPTSVTSFLIV
uniref:Protein kinase domain-containing protein n=1 Tax=Ditylum brightwellii TaxID=49249 RepID=A0A7S4SFR3_9STRA